MIFILQSRAHDVTLRQGFDPEVQETGQQYRFAAAYFASTRPAVEWLAC
jgi:hypothetical protein